MELNRALLCCECIKNNILKLISSIVNLTHFTIESNRQEPDIFISGVIIKVILCSFRILTN